jgi:hypothetical protein
MLNWLSGIWADPKDQEIIKSTIGPTVAILIFVVTNIIQAILAGLARRREIKRIVIGIYTEIFHNLEYSDRFLNSQTVFDRIKQRLVDDDDAATKAGKTPAYRPLLAITESSNFDDAIASTVPDIHANCVVAISLY